MCEQNVRGDHSFLQLNQFILHHGVLRKVPYQNKRNLDCLPVRTCNVTRSDQLILQFCQVRYRYPVRSQGGFISVFYSTLRHAFICRPSDFTVSEDAGIEPRAFAAAVSAVIRFK